MTLPMRRVMRRKEVCRTVGLSLSTVRRLEQAGDFPKGIRIGKQAIGYFADQVLAWLEGRAIVSPGPCGAESSSGIEGR